MLLLRFVVEEGRANPYRLAVGAFLASASSVALLLLINLAAEQLATRHEDGIDWVLAGAFNIAAVTYFFTESDLITQIGAAMERAVERVRKRLLEGVRQADFVRLERFGATPLYENITQHAHALSQNSQFIALSVRSAMLTAMVMLYILTLSVTAFWVVLAGTVGVGMMYYRLGEQLRVRYGRMMNVEGRLFQAVSDLLDGFREVRLSSARSRDLLHDFERVSAQSTGIRVEVQGRSFQKLIFGHVAFFFLLAVVVFVVPTYVTDINADIVKISAAVVFMIGPLGGVIQAVTVMASADAAVRRMFDLERELKDMVEPGDTGVMDAFSGGFECIEVRGASFAYPAAGGETPFEVGPVDLTIRRGEVVFVTGGNGSGKSSFIKMLIGLYRPERGSIRVDGWPVEADNRRAFRELFAVVFADQRLLPRLYGLPDIDRKELSELLDWLEIERIVQIDGDRLARTDYSSGQRKRIQLAAALLEHRPLLVLDEWAADQDPHFRRKFYRQIVPELKARGITIVAVTHDDQYFDVADRRLHFEFGKLHELDVGAHP